MFPNVSERVQKTPNDPNHGFTWFTHVCTIDTFDVYPVVNFFCIDIENDPVFLTYLFFG